MLIPAIDYVVINHFNILMADLASLSDFPMLLVCLRSPRSKITARITRSALQGAARTPLLNNFVAKCPILLYLPKQIEYRGIGQHLALTVFDVR